MEFVWGRYSGLFYTAAGCLIFYSLSIFYNNYWLLPTFAAGCLFALGFFDYFQKKRAVLGNFPFKVKFNQLRYSSFPCIERKRFADKKKVKAFSDGFKILVYFFKKYLNFINKK